jgi:phosphocarrier protein
MIKTHTTINNKLGLHARASAKLTKLAGSFPCDVFMSRGDRRINAKSIMGVMMLAPAGTEEIETIGRARAGHGCAARADRRKFGEGE